MSDPVITAITTSIGLAVDLCKFICKMCAASDEMYVFALLLLRVQKDLTVATHVRSIKDHHTAPPYQLEWADECLRENELALVLIGKLVMQATPDRIKPQEVTLKHRFQWVLHNKEEFLTKHDYVTTCHASLLGALNFLRTLADKEPEQIASLPPAYEGLPMLRRPSIGPRKDKVQKLLPEVLPEVLDGPETSLSELWDKAYGSKAAASITDTSEVNVVVSSAEEIPPVCTVPEKAARPSLTDTISTPSKASEMNDEGADMFGPDFTCALTPPSVSNLSTERRLEEVDKSLISTILSQDALVRHKNKEAHFSRASRPSDQ